MIEEHKGTLTQKFAIKLNMMKLQEYIADQIKEKLDEDEELKNVEIHDIYSEDGYLLSIEGSYDTDYESTFHSADSTCPECSQVDRGCIGKDAAWLLKDLMGEMSSMLSIEDVIEDENKVTIKD
nr:hypothetical protein [uncultured Butyrivibrio sp.]